MQRTRSSIEQAKPVIQLIRSLNWQIKCRFMKPKKSNITWQNWQTQLTLTDDELNEESVVKATINNTQGRMTIRLKKTGKSSAKFFEQYLMLSLLYSYDLFHIAKDREKEHS